MVPSHSSLIQTEVIDQKVNVTYSPLRLKGCSFYGTLLLAKLINDYGIVELFTGLFCFSVGLYQ